MKDLTENLELVRLIRDSARKHNVPADEVAAIVLGLAKAYPKENAIAEATKLLKFSPNNCYCEHGLKFNHEAWAFLLTNKDIPVADKPLMTMQYGPGLISVLDLCVERLSVKTDLWKKMAEDFRDDLAWQVTEMCAQYAKYVRKTASATQAINDYVATVKGFRGMTIVSILPETTQIIQCTKEARKWIEKSRAEDLARMNA